jgi:hypothetical protein
MFYMNSRRTAASGHGGHVAMAKDCCADPPAALLTALEDDNLEELIENDPALVPAGPSALLVEPAVLDPREIDALLCDLGALLAAAASDLADPALEGARYEPDAATTRRGRCHSKLPTLAWLFPDHAGIGRSARHQQGHHL